MVTLIDFLLQSKLQLQKIYHKRNIKNISQKKHILENPITNKDKCYVDNWFQPINLHTYK